MLPLLDLVCPGLVHVILSCTDIPFLSSSRLLVRHPEVMDRLRCEISSVTMDTAHLTREQIRKMPFLSCIIKESRLDCIALTEPSLIPPGLRLYPPVPLNNRQATATTILPTGGGPSGHSPILVRKGELVVFSQYVNSRVKCIYGQDAHHFRPERWEGEEMRNIGWAYFPFNGGPRQCLGEDFAVMEISVTIVRLLQACPVVAMPDGETIETLGTERQRLTLVLASADGCRVKIDGR
jgi:cytochrome P450